MMSMPLIRVVVILSLVLIIGWGYLFQQQRLQQARIQSDDPRVWQQEVKTLLAEQASVDANKRLLLLGDYWPLPADIAASEVLDRRLVGAKIVDLLYFLPQLLPEQTPRGIMIALGRQDFDPLLSRQPKSAQEFLRLFQQVIDSIAERWPELTVYLVLPGADTAAEKKLEKLIAQQKMAIENIELVGGRTADDSEFMYQHANRQIRSLIGKPPGQ